MADWTQVEDELIIADYFQMLDKELRGLPYNKSEHRRNLVKRLKKRNEGAIEFKHCNISAVLIKYGMPYIKGYQPRSNYQNLLEDEVLAVLQQRKSIVKVFNEFVKEKVEVEPATVRFDKWSTEAPERTEKPKKAHWAFNPVKKNYLEIEQRNASTGNSGEQLVYDYEIWRLKKAKLPELAKQVKWVSRDNGDGAGYDILSRDVKGGKMFIEVKTTKLGKESPIFFSNLEFEFSKLNKSNFYLYRVFNVKEAPKLFIKQGQLGEICLRTEPISYKGYF